MAHAMTLAGYHDTDDARHPCHSLTLADGTSWTLEGDDEYGSELVAVLAGAMGLLSTTGPVSRRLFVQNGVPPGAKPPDLPLVLGRDEDCDQSIIYKILPVENNLDLSDQLTELALIIASAAEARGGVLLHGALAAIDGRGVIMAGPSDVGKTTASRRLPGPWISLSDDCTLVVRDKKGMFYAHPWPTWSSFLLNGNQGQSWNVQAGVPLQAMFMLIQSVDNDVEPLGTGQSICMLNEAAEQAWWCLDTEFEKKKKEELRMQRFNNICDLAQTVPSYTLYLSTKGPFWKKIEQILVRNKG